MIAIKFENISKQYRLGTIGTGTLSHDLNRWWKMNIRGQDDPYLKIGETNRLAKESSAPSSMPHATGSAPRALRPAQKNRDSEFVWALRDINLEVEQGEVLDIIGRNEADYSPLTFTFNVLIA
jgi:lipopolysaccharide transport system ATP-binding protein